MVKTSLWFAQMHKGFFKICPAVIAAVTIATGAAVLRADSAPCTYGVGTVASEVAAAGGTVSIALATQTGCAWTATTDSSDVTQITPASGSDSANVQVTVAANPDPAPRLVNITLGDPGIGTVLHIVSQRGTSCTFAIARPPRLAAASGGAGSFAISTQPGCGWSVSATDAFVSFPRAAGLADATGLATIAYSVDPNAPGGVTRRTSITVTNPVSAVNSAFTVLAQGADGTPPLTSWNVGDVFAGMGSWFGDGGRYRAMNPNGALTASPDLNDAYGGTTTGCALDPNVAHGDLFTTSWDGLLISRFSDATHQLVSALDLTPAGLAAVQRASGTVPVPYTQNVDMGIPWPDFTYSEQLVFDQSGAFFVGGSMYETGSLGLGHAYLLKFAKNDGGSIPGCAAKSPCLLDWWRVDAAGEAPTGQNPAGANAQWTSIYKSAYLAASGDATARMAAARAAVAPLAASLSYPAGTPPQLPGPAGVDELDLSSDQHTVFYTSEDNRIRRFDTATGQQLTPLTITDPDTRQPYHGKAYGFRLLPDGSGHADGGAGLLVAMSIGIFRLDATGSAIKLSGANDIIQYRVDAGGSTPFSMNLTPDAQSFWVATTQNDSSQPTRTGGKIYRFHIPTARRYGPFNIGTGGADIDIQGLCVKREFTAGVNQCFKTDKDGKGVVDANGNAIPIACRTPTTCLGLGIDAARKPALDCYPPGEAPLTLADRSSFEGDRSGVDATSDLDLRPLTAGHDIVSLTDLPQGLQPVTDPSTGYIVGITGAVSWNTCPAELQDSTLASDALGVCTSYRVGVRAADGAAAVFTWNVHFRNAPPSIAVIADQTTFVNTAVSLSVAASDPDGQPLTYSVTGLPAGLTYSATTGTITGTPTGAATGQLVMVAVTDPVGASATTTFRWTVVANRAPVCSSAAPSQAIWAPNHKFVDVTVTGVADPDGDPVTITITSIWQSEPVTLQSSGNTSSDASGVGTPVASVRAERGGVKSTSAEGRLYEIRFAARDGKGGSCSGAIEVGIAHDQGSLSMPRDNGARYDSLTGSAIR